MTRNYCLHDSPRGHRRAAVALALGMSFLAGAPAASAQTIVFGEAEWSDAKLVTRLAARLIETRLDKTVAIRSGEIERQYQALAAGDLDAAMMVWLPDTHAGYMAEYGDRITQLGIIYSDARLGWVVPSYVEADTISSIPDLADSSVRAKLDGRIVGIDPGAGLMDHSREALSAYGLSGYDLVSGSEAEMLAELEAALEAREPIVVTAWSPHWIFGAYNLRYLGDPRRALGERERVHAAVRKGFYRAEPAVTGLLDRFYLPIDKLESLLFAAEQVEPEGAVERFVANNPELVDYWVTGSLD